MDDNLRIVRCIGLRESKIIGWSRVFTVGGVYEVLTDDGSMLWLRGDFVGEYQTKRWVDADQFQEITINELMQQLQS